MLYATMKMASLAEVYLVLPQMSKMESFENIVTFSR